MPRPQGPGTYSPRSNTAFFNFIFCCPDGSRSVDREGRAPTSLVEGPWLSLFVVFYYDLIFQAGIDPKAPQRLDGRACQQGIIDNDEAPAYLL